MYIKILKNLSFYINKEKRKLLNVFPFKRREPNGRLPKISAYLSIYNDADILEISLRSIANYVDELIVVDGAYIWMAPIIESTGRNPMKSDNFVYEKIQASGIPFKVINRIWKNEVEKRMAGYEATSHQYVMRIDADEVLFFNEVALKQFITSKCALAEMYMPNYAAPGWVIQGKRLIDKFRTYPRQSLLFDKKKISSSDHLRYLWLVLTADELPMLNKNQKIFSVFENPIAFCAHLTNWRFIDSSVNRSAFYTMNWMRKNGAPWVNKIGRVQIENFDKFFELVPPKIFLEIMKNNNIVQGDISLKSVEKLSKSPLNQSQEALFSGLHQIFIKKLQKRVLDIQQNDSFALSGYPFYLDITLSETLSKIAPNGLLKIKFSEPITNAVVNIKTLTTRQPFNRKLNPNYRHENSILTIELDSIKYGECDLRKSIEITVFFNTEDFAFLSYKFSQS